MRSWFPSPPLPRQGLRQLRAKVGPHAGQAALPSQGASHTRTPTRNGTLGTRRLTQRAPLWGVGGHWSAGENPPRRGEDRPRPDPGTHVCVLLSSTLQPKDSGQNGVLGGPALLACVKRTFPAADLGRSHVSSFGP